MRAVFLVPRRKDFGWRDRLWAFCRAKWERELPDIPIFEGHHDDGPFNRAAAINTAAGQAGEWDVGIVIDADVMVDAASVRRAVVEAARTGKVVWAFTQWRGLTMAGTRQILKGHTGDLAPLTEKLNPISWSCCFAVPRAVWDDIGGFDERFRGWGWEDMAWRVAVETRHGTKHLPGAVTHLWHERAESRAEVRRPDGMVLMSPEYYDNTRLGSRWMAVEGCEHCVGRLVEEAKVAKRALRRGVTVVVLTNGRREYIGQAIASADKHLHGEHIERRIWDDSADPVYREWLSHQFPEWHVVGPDYHLGYTQTMKALWRYLGPKARAPTAYVFLVEEDFVIERDVDLSAMVDVLGSQPHLAQLVLLRHPFYPKELEAGGIIEEHPESYERKQLNGFTWVEHERFWSNNPMLMRRSLAGAVPWPTERHSEAVYGRALLAKGLRFAFWGDGTPEVRHVGIERTGDGY